MAISLSTTSTDRFQPHCSLNLIGKNTIIAGRQRKTAKICYKYQNGDPSVENLNSEAAIVLPSYPLTEPVPGNPGTSEPLPKWGPLVDPPIALRGVGREID